MTAATAEENTVLFELRLSAEAEVIRGCCGREHEFGPCPFGDDDEDEDDGNVTRGENLT